MVAIAIAVPKEAMANFGIEHSSAMSIVVQFIIVTQLMVVLITFGLPRWVDLSLL